MAQLSLFPETPVSPPELGEGVPKLIVKGRLWNRKARCRPPQMLYLLNGLADWIDTHAGKGEGGRQAVINFLVAYAIRTLESNFEAGEILIAHLPDDAGSNTAQNSLALQSKDKP